MNNSSRPNNRLIPVLAGIAIQLCLGTAYIWGVFQPEVVQILAWTQKDAALTFSILLGVLTFGSMLGGAIQDKFSPRPVLIAGGIVLAVGFFFAGFATRETPWLLWLTYGVAGGFGMGMTYTTTIAVCQKWFPDKRGLITGIIVSALGFGGLVFTPIASALVEAAGVMETFKWLALMFLVVTVVCALFIKNPPKGFSPKGYVPPQTKTVVNYSPKQVLKSPQYYIIAVSMMLACGAGLMVIPFAKVLGMDGGLNVIAATAGVMVIAGFNSFGRLFWGGVSDRLGRKKTLILLMLIAAVTIPFAALVQGYMILVLIAAVGFSYGGFLGVFPAITADYFGLKSMGINYGIVLMGFGAGAVASSYVAGFFKDLTGGFLTPFLVASAAALLGAALIAFVKPPQNKPDVQL